MSATLAKSYFHGKEGYNCAQAVLKAFQDSFNIPEATIAEYKQYGGGRAEGGTCGALYAALQLTYNEQQQREITQAFQKAASYTRCEQIKEKTLACPNCVAAAASALEKVTSVK